MNTDRQQLERLIRQKREITIYAADGNDTRELVEIVIDMEHLAKHLGPKAYRNRRRVTVIYNAGVTVRYIGRTFPVPGPGNGP